MSRFAIFVFSARDQKAKCSPRKHHNRESEDEYLEKSEQSAKEIVESGYIPKSASSVDIAPISSRNPFSSSNRPRTEYVIHNRRNIQKKESYECIHELHPEFFRFFFRIRKYHDPSRNDHHKKQGDSRYDYSDHPENVQTEIPCGIDIDVGPDRTSDGNSLNGAFSGNIDCGMDRKIATCQYEHNPHNQEKK